MKKTAKLSYVAMFAALSSVLMFFQIPLPFLPSFLQLDLSDIPVMIGSIIFGPLAGVAIALIKSSIHLFATTTLGVGELADFLITCALIVPAGLFYKYKGTRSAVLIGSIIGILSMIIFGVLANKFLILPLYIVAFKFPEQAIVDMCKAVNPAVNDINGYYLFAVIPFNFIKGTLVSVFTIIVYKKLEKFFKTFSFRKNNNV